MNLITELEKLEEKWRKQAEPYSQGWGGHFSICSDELTALIEQAKREQGDVGKRLEEIESVLSDAEKLLPAWVPEIRWLISLIRNFNSRVIHIPMKSDLIGWTRCSCGEDLETEEGLFQHLSRLRALKETP